MPYVGFYFYFVQSKSRYSRFSIYEVLFGTGLHLCLQHFWVRIPVCSAVSEEGYFAFETYIMGCFTLVSSSSV
jgi:hypothetical protein